MSPDLLGKKIVATYPVPNPSALVGRLALGSDGNVWFTEQMAAAIGKITSTGNVTEYPIPSGSFALDIARGRNGTLWFTTQRGGSTSHTVGMITTSGVITEWALGSAYGDPNGITKGPDGNMWFIEGGFNSAVVKITLSGTMTRFALPQDYFPAGGITVGPDGNLWFVSCVPNGGGGWVGNTTTSGVVTEYYMSGYRATNCQIASGPDGNLYLPEMNGIWQVTTFGAMALFASSKVTNVDDIIVGPRKKLWITEPGVPRSKLDVFDTTTLSYGPAAEFRGSSRSIDGIIKTPNEEVWFGEGGAIGVYQP